MLDSEMKLKEEAYPIPEEEYDRFKYKLEEKSNVFAERNLMIFYIGVATGYRTGDIVKLTIGDLRKFIANDKFTIQESKQYKEWLTHKKKHPNSLKKRPLPREVPLNKNLKALLKNYVKNKNNSEYAFKSNKGNKYITQKSYSKILTEVGKELGLENISGHSLRKTYAHRLYNWKNDVEYVRRALGHTSIETTKRYLGLSKAVIREASEYMDDRI